MDEGGEELDGCFLFGIVLISFFAGLASWNGHNIPVGTAAFHGFKVFLALVGVWALWWICLKVVRVMNRWFGGGHGGERWEMDPGAASDVQLVVDGQAVPDSPPEEDGVDRIGADELFKAYQRGSMASRDELLHAMPVDVRDGWAEVEGFVNSQLEEAATPRKDDED